ncbi:MAG: hypothetical protein GXO21_03210 [Aquificae bacterium]|nr:hypothetical protein [Aquificota bacterium]
MLEIKNLYIDPYKISAYKLEKNKDNFYYFIFYIEGKEFHIEKYFKSEEEAFKWLEKIEILYPDTFLLPDEDEETVNIQNSKESSKIKSFLEKGIAFFVFIFFLFAFFIGAIFIFKEFFQFLKTILNF